MVEETNGWRNVGFGDGEVYGRVWDKSEIKSEVENTLTLDCFLNAFSLDQIGKSEINANAKYSTSFGCEASFNPSDNLPAYSRRENSKSCTTPSVMNAAKTLLASNLFNFFLQFSRYFNHHSAISSSNNNVGNAHINTFSFLHQNPNFHTPYY